MHTYLIIAGLIFFFHLKIVVIRDGSRERNEKLNPFYMFDNWYVKKKEEKFDKIVTLIAIAIKNKCFKQKMEKQTFK